jgi:hypothetical protein
MIFAPGKNTEFPFAVTAPRFIKVRHKATHAQQFGPGNDFVCGTVEFALDTSSAGDLSGAISVTLGNATAKMPVSATVKTATKGLTRVLIVETPFDRYSTGDGGDYKVWTDLVKDDASLDVNYLLVSKGKPVLRDLDLGKYDCVLLAEMGLVSLQAADIKRVREFAEAGGRVVVAANHFFRGTVAKANAVLDGYGIQMRDEESKVFDPVGRRAKGATLGKSELDPMFVKEGVTSAHFSRASPVAVANDKASRILAKAMDVGMPGDGFVALARAGKGEVVALGQSLWWNWINEKRAAGTDNALLLRWLLQPPIMRSRSDRLLATRNAPTPGGKANAADIVLWETATGKEVATVKTSGFSNYALLPDERCVVTIESGVVVMRDAANGAVRLRQPLPESELGLARQSWVSQRVLLPDGRTAFPASPLEAKVGEPELAAWWSDLHSDDARAAWRAVWSLTDVPQHAVPWLAGRLKPVAGPEEAKLRRWLADLDSDDFTTRENAHRELARVAELIEPVLTETLKGKAAPELRRRLSQMLAQPRNRPPTGEELRQMRAVAALEQMHTPPTRKLLERLASGAPGARQTREARAALERLVQ